MKKKMFSPRSVVLSCFLLSLMPCMSLWFDPAYDMFRIAFPPHYEAILGFFANSQDCSQSKVLESLFSADLASPCSQKRRFYMFDFIRRYIWSKIQLVMKDLKHSIQNQLNNIVEHITSPRIWTFTVLLSLALHTAGQRPLEGS